MRQTDRLTSKTNNAAYYNRAVS